jgi:hypothetical protein
MAKLRSKHFDETANSGLLCLLMEHLCVYICMLQESPATFCRHSFHSFFSRFVTAYVRPGIRSLLAQMRAGNPKAYGRYSTNEWCQSGPEGFRL